MLLTVGYIKVLNFLFLCCSIFLNGMAFVKKLFELSEVLLKF